MVILIHKCLLFCLSTLLTLLFFGVVLYAGTGFVFNIYLSSEMVIVQGDTGIQLPVNAIV